MNISCHYLALSSDAKEKKVLKLLCSKDYDQIWQKTACTMQCP